MKTYIIEKERLRNSSLRETKEAWQLNAVYDLVFDPEPEKKKGFFFFFCLFRAVPTAYGGSQRAAAASLHHSCSNTRSAPPLQPTPQLRATPDPWPTKRGQGLNLCPVLMDTSQIRFHGATTGTVAFSFLL